MAELGALLGKKTNKNQKKSGSPNTGTGPNVKSQMEFIQVVMMGVILVLFASLLASIFSYFQFVKDANTDYKNTTNEFNKTVKDYNDKRDTMFENRIKVLEEKITSLSAK